jgi:hypothetical protein
MGVGGEFKSMMPGLFNWVIAMERDEVTEILSNNAAHSEILLRAQRESLLNEYPLLTWLESNVIADESLATQVGVARAISRKVGDESERDYVKSDEWLFPNYRKFCDDAGIKPLSMQKFSKILINNCVDKNMLNIPFVCKTQIDDKVSAIQGLRLRKTDETGASPFDLRFPPTLPYSVVSVTSRYLTRYLTLRIP